MQIKEIREENSGYDKFPLLLKRQKLRKAPTITH